MASERKEKEEEGDREVGGGPKQNRAKVLFRRWERVTGRGGGGGGAAPAFRGKKKNCGKGDGQRDRSGVPKPVG